MDEFKMFKKYSPRDHSRWKTVLKWRRVRLVRDDVIAHRSDTLRHKGTIKTDLDIELIMFTGQSCENSPYNVTNSHPNEQKWGKSDIWDVDSTRKYVRGGCNLREVKHFIIYYFYYFFFLGFRFRLSWLWTLYLQYMINAWSSWMYHWNICYYNIC